MTGLARLSLLALLALNACKPLDQPTTGTDSLRVELGAGQTGRAGRALPVAPVVRAVHAADGTPVAGALLVFTPTGGGTVASPDAMTDSTGRVSPGLWTLGADSGTQHLTVSGVGFISTTIEAHAFIASDSLIVFSGNDQTGAPSAALPVHPVFQAVRESDGGIIAGAVVTFTVTAGSGTVQHAQATTDASGLASPGQWTLGPASGVQRVTASSPGMKPVSAAAVALSNSPSITLVLTSVVPPRVDSMLVVEVQVFTTFAIATMTATVEGRATNLAAATTPNGPRWVGTVDFRGLPRDSLVLVIRATDAAGGVEDLVVRLLHDHAPVITILLPLHHGVGRPTFQVSAICADDQPGGCDRIEVGTLPSTVLLSGSGSSVSGTLDLSSLVGLSVPLAFWGVDRWGRGPAYIASVLVLEANAHQREIGAAPGYARDLLGQRLLFVEGSDMAPNRRFGIRNLASATDSFPAGFPLSTGSSSSLGVDARLTPQGALVAGSVPSGCCVYEVRAGAVTGPSGDAFQATGNWAVVVGTELIRIDLSTGAERVLVNDVAGANLWFHVHRDGDVVWTSGLSSIVMWLRGGTIAALVPSTSAIRPVTDGSQVVYAMGNQIARHDGLGEILLGGAITNPVWHQHYEVNGGWAAYAATVAGVQQVFTRSPAGLVRQATQLGSAVTIEALSPTGDVVVRAGGRLYLSRPPYPAVATDLGRSTLLHRVEWRDTRFVAYTWGSVTEIIP